MIESNCCVVVETCQSAANFTPPFEKLLVYQSSVYKGVVIFKVEFPSYLEHAVRKIANQENISIDCIAHTLEGMYKKNKENRVEDYSTNYSKERSHTFGTIFPKFTDL